MNSVVKAGVMLAVAVAVIQLVFLAAGLHESPMLGFVSIAIFIALTIGAVVWALKQTRADSGYGKQLMNGAVIGVVAGILILLASFVLQSYIFPNSLQESRDATVAWMEGLGMPEAQLDAQVAKLDQQTTLSQAVTGSVFTVITSLIVAAIAAIFLRRK